MSYTSHSTFQYVWTFIKLYNIWHEKVAGQKRSIRENRIPKYLIFQFKFLIKIYLCCHLSIMFRLSIESWVVTVNDDYSCCWVRRFMCLRKVRGGILQDVLKVLCIRKRCDDLSIRILNHHYVTATHNSICFSRRIDLSKFETFFRFKNFRSLVFIFSTFVLISWHHKFIWFCIFWHSITFNDTSVIKKIVFHLPSAVFVMFSKVPKYIMLAIATTQPLSCSLLSNYKEHHDYQLFIQPLKKIHHPTLLTQ